MVEIGIVLLAYLIGSIPMAYVMGRSLKRIDIRRYGSGNVGTSNIWVHVGKRAAFPLAAFDILLKGAFPVYLAQELSASSWIAVMAGLATVAGHNWSLYLKPTETQYTRGPRSAQPARCEFRADLVRVCPRSSNRSNTRMCLWVQGTPCHHPTRLAAIYAPTPSISKKKMLGKVNTNTRGLTSPATT